MNETQINQIVEQVVRRLSNELGNLPSASGAPRAAPMQQAPAIHGRRPGVFDDMDSAVAAAAKAYEAWGQVPVDTRVTARC